MSEWVDNSREVIQNDLSGGLALDYRNRPELSPPNTYIHALNATKKSRDAREVGLTNKLSFTPCNAFGADTIGFRLVDEYNWSIGIDSSGKIWRHDHRTCESDLVMDPEEFGCDFGCTDCEWVGSSMEFYTKGGLNSCPELYMQWSCGCEYYVINVHEMLDEKRRQGLKEKIACDTCRTGNCEHFRVFRKACPPKITVKSYNTGGALSNGAYIFAFRYRYESGGVTNISEHSQPAFVASGNNISGSPGRGSISVNLSCLDCNFGRGELIVIETLGGGVSAKVLEQIGYNNDHYTFTYTGQRGKPITLEEVLLPANNLYVQGRYQLQYLNSMIYYGLKTPRQLNYQGRALAIEIGYEVAEMSVEYACKYDIRGLMGGEAYSFAIMWNFCDQTHTPAFPLTPLSAGCQPGEPSVSTAGLDTFNPDATGGSTTNGDNSSANLPTVEPVCEFVDDDLGIDFTYEGTLVPSGSDTLTLRKTGMHNLLPCISDCVDQNKTTRIYLTGHNGEKHEFDVYTYNFASGDELQLEGNLFGGTSGLVDARHIYVVHFEGTSQGGGPSGGSGGSGGSGAQSQVSGNPNVSISTPQCVVRFRTHDRDEVSEVELDEYDDKLQEMLDKITSTAMHKCEELKLIEESRQAEGCQCRPTVPPPTILVPGSNCIAQLQTADTNNDGIPDSYEFSDSLADGHPCPDITGITAVGDCCPTGSPLPPGEDYNRCIADMRDYELGAVHYVNVLNDLGIDEIETTFTNGTFNDVAKEFMRQAIQQRERVRRKVQTYSVAKSVSYQSGGTNPTDSDSVFADNYTDCCGIRETETDIRIVSRGRPIPKYERDITYPCDRDCSGQPIFCGLAGQPVAHAQFPDRCQEPHFIGKSVGVPGGTYWRDANPYSDLYVRHIYPTFSNIQIPTEEELGKPLCPNNPYTILMTPRTDSNRSIRMKALATGTFVIDNGGTTIHNPRHGVNSRMEVSAYHEGGGEYPRLANAGSGSSFTLFSPDACVRQPALNVHNVSEELRLMGVGERFGLYAAGDNSDDDIHAERIDKLGARSAVNLSQWAAGSCTDIPINGALYAPAVGTNHGAKIAPGHGMTAPLMQAYQQASLWIDAALPEILDDSMPGDVLEHNVPINHAEASYVAVKSDLPNQYGNLDTMEYIPILHGGKNNQTSIKGIVGDTYIQPYSFVKTSHVSDRYGSCEPGRKFNIPAQVPIKRERRCLCDTPDDAIHGYLGDFVWTSLPESGDAADPKNWLGLRTHNYNHTDTHAEAGSGPAVSDFFFPRTSTTEIIFPVETEINLKKRHKKEALADQWMPELDQRYQYDSGVEVDAQGGRWEDSWLNQFGCELRQPSQFKILMKRAIRTYIGMVQPMQALQGGSNIPSTFSDTFAFASGGLLATAWHFLNQVILTPDKIDEILGIPVCKTDEVGHQGDGCIRGFFTNQCDYDMDYSIMSQYKTYRAATEEYNRSLCVCDQCELGQTNNVAVWSEPQLPDGHENGFRNIRPRNRVIIDPSEGKLTNLFIHNNNLYYQTTDKTNLLRASRAVIPSNIGDILLGTGDFLQHSASGTSAIEGYAGLQHKNHFMNTNAGPVWIDQEAAKIFWMQGGSIVPISDIDGFSWFKEHLPFCEETQCKNEHKAGTSYYALGHDPRAESFYITKSDGNPKGSWTLEFDYVAKHWVSFHSEIPRVYNWDRYDAYQLHNSGYFKLHKDCAYGGYGEYDGPFEVWVAARSPDLREFKYQYTDVFALVEKCEGCTWVKDIDEFFTTIAVYNSTQSTGNMNTIVRSDDKMYRADYPNLIHQKDNQKQINVFKRNREWRFNEVHDIINPCTNVPVVTCDACEPFYRINEVIGDCLPSQVAMLGRTLDDRFVVYKFSYDQAGQKQIVLNTVTTYIKDSAQ